MYKFITKLSELSPLKGGQPLYVDFETSPDKIKGVKHTNGDKLYAKIRLAQFYSKGWKKVLLLKEPCPKKLLAYLKTVHWVAYNIHYEVSTLQVQTKVDWIPAKFDCLFLLAKISIPSLDKFDLYSVCEGAGIPTPNLDKKDMQISDWSEDLTEEQLVYACYDVLVLPKLHTYLLGRIGDNVSHGEVYNRSKALLKIALKLQRQGIPFDHAGANKKALELSVLSKLKDSEIGYNPRSSKQVGEQLGMTSTGKFLLIEEHVKYCNLNNIKSDGDYMTPYKNVIEGRSLAKKVSTLLSYGKRDKYLAYKDKVGGDKLYGFFSPRTITGRWASNNHNLQNIPREFTNLVRVPNKSDYRLAVTDFSNLELRGIACLVGDREMVRLFKNKVDVHGHVTRFFFGSVPKEEYKSKRFLAKTCNFTLLYGAGAKTLQSRLIESTYTDVSLSQAETFKSSWLELFKDIASWQKLQGNIFEGNPLSSSPLGRRFKASKYTDFLNYQNQSFGADVANEALMRIDKDLKKFKGFTLFNYVHDEFGFIVPKSKVQWKSFGKMVMENCVLAWRYVCKESDRVRIKNLPLPVNIGFSNNLKDLKNEENLIMSLSAE